MQDEVVQTMIQIKKLCEDLERNCIYFDNYDKIFTVDQFIQVHKNNISSMKNLTRETLEDNIKSTIENGLGNVGKGWFNLNGEKES